MLGYIAGGQHAVREPVNVFLLLEFESEAVVHQLLLLHRPN